MCKILIVVGFDTKIDKFQCIFPNTLAYNFEAEIDFRYFKFLARKMQKIRF